MKHFKAVYRHLYHCFSKEPPTDEVIEAHYWLLEPYPEGIVSTAVRNAISRQWDHDEPPTVHEIRSECESLMEEIEKEQWTSVSTELTPSPSKTAT